MKKLPINITTVFCMFVFATVFTSSPVLSATKKMTVQQMKKKIDEQQNTIDLLKLKLYRCGGENYSGATHHDDNIPPAIDAPPILRRGEPMMSYP